MSIKSQGLHDALLRVLLQNLGRFGKMKLNKVIFFCLFGIFLSVSIGGYAAKLAAAEKQIVPRQMCSEFDRDGASEPSVHYDLFLLKKIHLWLQQSL